ncbi:MAG: GNAT family N-acetyltransferase [Rhizobacter sp.]|nr:GNAT family N-acetyltransferase [Ferruginibacter sp.]
MTLIVTEHISLQLTAPSHAPGLFDAVDNNREHLSRFLPWVNNMQSVDDFKKYIQHCELQYRQNTDVSFVIIVNGMVAGRIGLHYIHPHNKLAAIGYWLSAAFVGRGIIIKSCKTILHYGFEELGLNRIEIKAAVKNIRSQAVPEKLGFAKEGILRQAELVNDEYLDLVLYSLLKEEWLPGI